MSKFPKEAIEELREIHHKRGIFYSRIFDSSQVAAAAVAMPHLLLRGEDTLSTSNRQNSPSTSRSLTVECLAKRGLSSIGYHDSS